MHGNDHIYGGPDPIPVAAGSAGENLHIFCEQTNLPATADNAYHIYPIDLTIGGTTPDDRDLGNGTPFVPSDIFDYDFVNAAILLKATGLYLWNIRFWGANYPNDVLTWDIAVGWAIGPPVSDYPGDETINFSAKHNMESVVAPGAGDYTARLVYSIDQLWMSPIPSFAEPAPFQVFYKHNGSAGGGELSALSMDISFIPAVWANPEGA